VPKSAVQPSKKLLGLDLKETPFYIDPCQQMWQSEKEKMKLRSVIYEWAIW
jgi:hypothetical protein